jgi:hypothetical protein
MASLLSSSSEQALALAQAQAQVVVVVVVRTAFLDHRRRRRPWRNADRTRRTLPTVS